MWNAFQAAYSGVNNFVNNVLTQAANQYSPPNLGNVFSRPHFPTILPRTGQLPHLFFGNPGSQPLASFVGRPPAFSPYPQQMYNHYRAQPQPGIVPPPPLHPYNMPPHSPEHYQHVWNKARFGVNTQQLYGSGLPPMGYNPHHPSYSSPYLHLSATTTTVYVVEAAANQDREPE